VSLFVLSPDFEDLDEVEVGNWTFQLQGFEVFQVSSPVTKKATSTVSIEIHKGAIFHRLKINNFFFKPS
jgi:hypothetical protein